ncbi:hypothetical protein LEP1GSC087_4063 [Leptospira interrogans serovar Bataviae str. L1111]|nr:hypothetical protein LEP1GSC087_4063 [Leptospira interrogans serovar Bataviae str. L1111]
MGINKTVFVLIDVSIKQMGNSFFNIFIENVVFGFYRNSL